MGSLRRFGSQLLAYQHCLTHTQSPALQRCKKLSLMSGVHFSTRSSCRHFWQLRPCRGCVSTKPTLFMKNIRVFSKASHLGRNRGVVTPVFLKADSYGDRIGLVDQHGNHTYSDLHFRATQLSDRILSLLGNSTGDLHETKIAFLCQNDASYVVAQWAVWMSGGVAVPLFKNHPATELEYFIKDSESKLIISTMEFKEKIQPITTGLGLPSILLGGEDFLKSRDGVDSGDLDPEAKDIHLKRRAVIMNLLTWNKFKQRAAQIIYTSGTTGKPKGVVSTHGNIVSNVEAMVKAWGWSSHDTILHVLPLHHVHGVNNCLITPLYCGATCVILPNFDATKVWSKLLGPISKQNPIRINVFMAVPTIYAKLIEDYERRHSRGRGTKRSKEFIKNSCINRIRLMVSGSMALPEPIMKKWEEITGHQLLERYGMTETGMVLGNPLQGPRIPGTVGVPFPGVEVCIAKQNVYAENGYDIIAQGNSKRTRVTPGQEGEIGELYIKGPGVFKEYYNRPDATADTMTKDGWFKTGDTTSFKDGVYSILGRTSVDIIKSGGYKISALDIERHLLAHENITDCAVVGLPDLTWGQKVAAVLVLREGTQMSLQELREWSRDKMPPYHIPTVLKDVPSLPRNAMGKVNKKELVSLLFPGQGR